MQLELRQAGVRHGPGAAALAPLDVRLRSGEHLAVIGPSGAGKTTLLHVLACSLRPTDGAIAVDGQDPWTLPASALQRLRGGLFLAPQVPPLPPRQRVVTAVLAGRLPHQGLLGSLRSLVYPDDIPGAAAALAAFDLADKLFERVDRLSGGERQRVGLARALMAQAGLILVDEPLSALDPARASQALSTVCEAAHRRGATLVATLHDVPAALRHFPRVLGLRQGRAVFDLPAREVTPAHLQALYEGEAAAVPPPAEVTGAGPSPAPLICR